MAKPIKSFVSDSAKELWRKKMVEFINRYYTPSQCKELRVLCLPGAEMREVFEVYDILGVRRRNIVGLEELVPEYGKLTSKNESLDSRIRVDNHSTTDFFSTQRVTSFDVISLDYCGFFDLNKIDTLAQIAFRGWLSPRGIIITNYQMARENKDMKTTYALSSFLEEENWEKSGLLDYYKRMVEFEEPETLSYDLTSYRDRAVQVAPLNYMHNGACWNTPFFQAWLKTRPKILKDPCLSLVEKLNQNKVPNPFKLFGSYFLPLIYQDYGIFGSYIMDREAHPHKLKDHAAYKYVSNSHTPMISDLYYFIPLEFNIPPPLTAGLGYKIVGGQLKLTLSGNKNRSRIDSRLAEIKRSITEKVWEFKYELKGWKPLEREVLRAAILPKAYRDLSLDKREEGIILDILTGKTPERVRQKYDLPEAQYKKYIYIAENLSPQQRERILN